MRSYGHVLLASTAFSALLLTGCGDSKADIAADKAAEGVTSDGKKGETPTGTEGSLPAIKTFDQQWAESADVQEFKRLKAEYAALETERDRLSRISIRDWTPQDREASEAFFTARTQLQKNLDALETKIAEALIDQRTAAYRAYDPEGDLNVVRTPDAPWSDLRNVALNLDRYNPHTLAEMITSTLGIQLLPDEINRILGDYDRFIQTPVEETADVDEIDDEASDDGASTTSTVASSVSGAPHENYTLLQEAYERAVEERTAKIFANELYYANVLADMLTATKDEFVSIQPKLTSKAYTGADLMSDFKTGELSAPARSINISLQLRVDEIIHKALINKRAELSFNNISSIFLVKGALVGDDGVQADDVFSVRPSSSSDNYVAVLMKPSADGTRYETAESGKSGLALTVEISADKYKAIQKSLYDKMVAALRKSHKGFQYVEDEDGDIKLVLADSSDSSSSPVEVDLNPFAGLFDFLDSPTALALSAETPLSLDTGLSVKARRAGVGSVDLTSLTANGINGQVVDLGLPVFVQLNGNVSGNKTTDKLTGSVAYRLGNTVIGAIQAYANSGTGFETESNQLETSVVMSHNLGSFFIEGQLGMVSADNVHTSAWSGLRSQLTLGLDTEYVSPFIQISHRQLDKDSAYHLNDTAAYLGLDMDIASLTADTYVLTTRLTTKVGYGEKHWKDTDTDLGATRGVTGSVAWSASLNLNSGVSFTTHLNLDTASGSNAGLNITLNR
ncbi:MAG: hypothetical protein H6492_01000 [Candidatus Paracaedibacteraceae bacterium]|nr:hypothetical protein [Candidatus Paracaedibacteraceae bacterium]